MNAPIFNADHSLAVQPSVDITLPTGVKFGESALLEVTLLKEGKVYTMARVCKYGFELATVPISAGTFIMGSSNGSNIGDQNHSGLNTVPSEPGRKSFESQHLVTLSKNFLMGKYEVTNAQFADFLNANKVPENGEFTTTFHNGRHGIKVLVQSSDKFFHGRFNWGVVFNTKTNQWEPNHSETVDYSNHPIIFVTWFGAMEFAKWVGGNLPTEVQWEYACRGKLVNKPFGVGTGDRLDYTLAAFGHGHSYALPDGEYIDNHPTLSTTLPIHSFSPNTWGIYNMHGNVSEWCRDSRPEYVDYPLFPVIDPVNEITDVSYVVVRGGSLASFGNDCRAAAREGGASEFGLYTIGFRIVIP